jgi:hypothetical protein
MVNAISFCLYGSNPRYTLGMLENIKIINDKLKDFKVYIYYNNVPEDILEQIKTYNNVDLIISSYNGSKTMLDRFKPIDIVDVDVMFVRDADSRIHDRDLWAINEFINSTKKLHIIRDHECHCSNIMGGLWGIKKGLINFNIENAIKDIEEKYENIYGVDERILSYIIYNEALKTNDYLLHGRKIHSYENPIEFPLSVLNDDFCGQVINYNGERTPYRVYGYK